MKISLYLFLFVTAVQAQPQKWGMMIPKTVLTNDIQQFYVGTQNGQNDFSYTLNNYGSDLSITIKFFLNGQPNNVEQPDPLGAILSGNFYDSFRKGYSRKLYYRAPGRMPDKNPIDIKAVVTLADGSTTTVSTKMYILAERWTFQHFHALRYKCYEDGESNPKNYLAVDMGMGTGMEQHFHFDPKNVNPQTGEAIAKLDGAPDIYYAKTYENGACHPSDMLANLLWGDDDQTTIKDVKARFTGQLMKVDYKVDYMNYLGWTFTHKPTGKTIPGIPRRPGSHNVQAGFECPLQQKFRSIYKMPPEQQVMLHVASGIQLQADN